MVGAGLFEVEVVVCGAFFVFDVAAVGVYDFDYFGSEVFEELAVGFVFVCFSDFEVFGAGAFVCFAGVVELDGCGGG